VFELVLYQARYMLNDLADADVDRLHVAAEGRKRLPPGPEARRWSAVVIAGRIVVGLGVVATLPDPARGTTLAATAGVVAATAAYEAARAPMRRPGAGEVVRRDRPLFLQRPGALAVVALIGAGYAVRVALGIALAGASGAVVAAAVVLGWLFGTVGVLGAWLMEAASLRRGGDRTVLARKAHMATIADLIGDDPSHLDRPALRGGGAHLVGGLLVPATAAAVVVGVGLTGWPGAAPFAALLVVAAGVAPALLALWPSPWAGPVAVVAAVGAGVALVPGGRLPVALLLAVVMATPALFRAVRPEALYLGSEPSGSPPGSPGGPPGDPGPASPGATTARPGRARGRGGAGARSHPGSEPASRR
jgi:hypothetical protein